MLILDYESRKPLYIQLYQQVKDQILSGILKRDVKLPSSRSLTKDLHISRSTVDVAYQQLVSEGYIYSKPKSGYYVGDIDISLIPVIQKEKHQELIPQKMPKKEFTYNLQYGKLLHDKKFFATWQKLTNDCLREYKNQFAEYIFIEGEIGLRNEIMKYLHEYRGVKCSIEQIIVCGGTPNSIGLICQLLLGKPSSVAIEEPGLSWAYRIFQNYNFTIYPIKLDDFGLSVNQLKSTDAKVAYVTPSHQFPTGKIMPISRRLELIEWAIRHNGLIIEDDYTGHFRYNIKPIPSLQSLCPSHVIYLGSVSKFLFPSVRVSYMVLPDNLVARFNEVFAGLPSGTAFFAQKTLELFMQEGSWDSYLKKINKQLKKKHDVLIESLKMEFGDTITISGSGAGLHILIKVKWPMKADELISRAAQAGVNILPPSELWFGKEDDTYGEILLGFGGIDAESIPKAIKLLRHVWLEE